VLATNLVDLLANQLRPNLRALDANWQFSWCHDLDRLLLAAGMVAAVRGTRRVVSLQGLWYLLAGILALLLLDELSPLHATVGHISKLLYVPILIVLVVCLWRLVLNSPERAIVGAALLTLSGSFGMHVVGLTMLRPIGYMSWPYQAGVGI
jgi:hypothetical protein